MPHTRWLIEGDGNGPITGYQHDAEVDPSIPDHYSPELASLVRRLLDFDVSLRHQDLGLDSDTEPLIMQDIARPDTKSMRKLPGIQWGRAQHEAAVM